MSDQPRRGATPPAGLDPEGAGWSQLAQQQLQLGTDVHRLSRQVHAMKDTLDSHIEDLIELKGQARDTSMVKRLVVGLFVLIIPFLVAGVVKAIQSDNDVAHLQKQADVQAQRGEQVQRDVGVIKADIREFGARQEALRRDLDQDIGQVQRTLDRIEESNERRRPR